MVSYIVRYIQHAASVPAAMACTSEEVSCSESLVPEPPPGRESMVLQGPDPKGPKDPTIGYLGFLY